MTEKTDIILKDGDSREIIFETGELDEISVVSKMEITEIIKQNTKFTFNNKQIFIL